MSLNAVAIAVLVAVAASPRDGADAPPAPPLAPGPLPDVLLGQAAASLDADPAAADAALVRALADWGAAPDETAPADHALYLRALAAARLGEPGRVPVLAAELRRRWPESVTRPALARLEADALMRAGDLRAARAACEALRRQSRGATDQRHFAFLVADLDERLGDVRAAAASYRRLLIAAPGDDLAREAERRLAALARAGVEPPPLSVAERRRHVRALLDAGMAAEARTELEALGAVTVATPERRAGIELLRAEIELDLGLHDEAMARLKIVAGAAEVGEAVVAQALVMLARAHAQRGEYDEAIRRRRELAERFPQHRDADESAFMAAWLPFDAGRHVEALAAFEALAARGARTSRAAQVRWFVGWNNYRLGRFVEAAAQFAQLGAEFPEVRDKALYWQARSAERAGQQEAARLYARLVRDAPLDWYGVLARTRSGASLPAPPPPAAPPLRTTPTSHVRLRRAERLLSAGLAQAAVWEIDAVPSSARRRRPSGEVLADLYARAGAPRAALRAAAQHLGTRLSSPPVAADVALARHLYPRAFADVVRDRAAATRLPAVLVWGLMRQESEFEPDARSHAGAIGLLQVMAPTAARTAALREEPPPSEEELATPAVNVALGTHYLRALIDKFAGQVVPALAAYNGGPPNVTKWLEREGTLPLDEFVEEIPFLESREYVKKVLGNSVVFGWLYGEDPWLDGALALRWRLDTKVAPQPDF